MTNPPSPDRFPDALAFTWRHENDGQPFHVTPGDHGGATAWGVTIGAFQAWRAAHGVRLTTEQDLRAAKQSDLQPLIKAWYWDAVRAAELPAGVDLLTYEFGYGSGPGASIRVLQQVLGLTDDGALGPVTLAAVAKVGQSLIPKLSARHAAFYRSLGQPRFLNGWLRRNNDRLTLACQWVGMSSVPVQMMAAPVATPRPATVASEVAMVEALNARSLAQHS